MRTTGRADAPVNNVRSGIEVGPNNLIPDPFPSGNGNRNVGRSLFKSGKVLFLILLPFPRGKGPGVRFSDVTRLLISTLLLATTAAGRFTRKCSRSTARSGARRWRASSHRGLR